MELEIDKTLNMIMSNNFTSQLVLFPLQLFSAWRYSV